MNSINAYGSQEQKKNVTDTRKGTIIKILTHIILIAESRDFLVLFQLPFLEQNPYFRGDISATKRLCNRMYKSVGCYQITSL